MAKTVKLAERLDGAASLDLVDTLKAHRGEDITLDGSVVDMLGSLCLEALLSIRHVWAQEGHKVTLENASDNLLENLGRFGLDDTKFNNGDLA